MKRLKYLIIALVFSLSVFLGACSCKKDDTVIRLNEVTHSVFYAPLYIAMNKGFFADEGIKIELTNGGGADKSMVAVVSNNADIGLMGPEAAIYVAEQEGSTVPKIFGQLTKRDGSFLIGRTPNENFQWSDLEGKEIIAGRAGGAPAMTLEYALKEIGLINGQNINLNLNVQFNNMAAAFIGGQGDYVTLFEPTASDIIASGQGYLMGSVGEFAGEVPFTAFMATEKYINKNPERIKKFLKAVYRGYEFLMTASVDDVANALQPSFSTTERNMLIATIVSYKAIDAWSETPVMKESAYNRLVSILQYAGDLQTSISFSSIVDNKYANEVMNELSK